MMVLASIASGPVPARAARKPRSVDPGQYCDSVMRLPAGSGVGRRIGGRKRLGDRFVHFVAGLGGLGWGRLGRTRQGLLLCSGSLDVQPGSLGGSPAHGGGCRPGGEAEEASSSHIDSSETGCWTLATRPGARATIRRGSAPFGPSGVSLLGVAPNFRANSRVGPGRYPWMESA